MDRRTALRNMTMTLGYAVATPTVMGILNSCKSDVASWTPKFFTPSQGHSIRQLADIILPATDIAGALDVNVPEFIDKMFFNIVPEEEKSLVQEGAEIFATEFELEFGKNASRGSKDEYQKLLEKYFNVSDEEKNRIFIMLKNGDSIKGDERKTFLVYKYLISVRQYTLFGYYTSEHVGEKILSYDPIPGKYDPCIPLNEVGNAWSLS